MNNKEEIDAKEYKTISVEKEFHEELKAFSKKCGINMSSFVRAASKRHMMVVEEILGMKDE
jgi:methionyl-tRNA synthetase|tara:strand:+ start:2282 stop:2464 length:183 start_codon:yes stop_codon:yes gene_type:complete